MNKHPYFMIDALAKIQFTTSMEGKKIYFSQGLGSRVKYFLHRQSALSATLFIAQAETAELTAVMSLALMECFVPQRVRMPPGSVRAAKGSSMREPRWLTVAPFFKCEKPSLSSSTRLPMAPNTLHNLIEAFTPLSWLCVLMLWKISVFVAAI